MCRFVRKMNTFMKKEGEEEGSVENLKTRIQTPSRVVNNLASKFGYTSNINPSKGFNYNSLTKEVIYIIYNI